MKKLIAGTAIAALAAASLSAEITFGSWGRALWITAANAYDAAADENRIATDIHQSWGSKAPRIGLAVSGNSDNYGYVFDIHNNGTDFGQGDNAYAWVKPADWVKINVGKQDRNELRGDACFGLWNWDRIGCVDGQEGWTFADYLDCEGFGVEASFFPVEGLTLGVALPLKEGVGDDGLEEDGPRTLSGVWAHKAAYVAAYSIEGVGTIKGAIKMQPKFQDDAHALLAAAFDYTGNENLYASVGLVTDTHSDIDPIQLTAYAKYSADALAVHFLAGVQTNQAYVNKDGEAKDNGLAFTVGAGVDYNLENNISLFADVRYANGLAYGLGTITPAAGDDPAKIERAQTDADHSDNITFGLGVAKGFSNGSLGVAFEGSTNNGGRYILKPNDDGVTDKFSWEIPVKFEYWF